MQTSANSPTYPALLSNFTTYKNIIKKTNMHAKQNYKRYVFNR